MRIGMVFQKPNPFPKSIFENVAYGLRVRGERSRRVIAEKVEAALRDASLWDEVSGRSTTWPSRCRAVSSSACALPGRWRRSRN